MKVIIAGSRTVAPSVNDIDSAAHQLTGMLVNLGLLVSRPSCGDASWVSLVISGTAPGADRSGETWAGAHGLPVHLEPIVDADIQKFGRYAGPRMRNRRMAEMGDAALLFWDGVSGGTSDMGMRMLARGKPALVCPTRPRPRKSRAR